jgi:hypothetical protein
MMDKSFSEGLLVRFDKGSVVRNWAERQVDIELQAQTDTGDNSGGL